MLPEVCVCMASLRTAPTTSVADAMLARVDYATAMRGLPKPAGHAMTHKAPKPLHKQRTCYSITNQCGMRLRYATRLPLRTCWEDPC